MPRSRMAWLALALTLTGCGATAPSLVTPETPLPADRAEEVRGLQVLRMARESGGLVEATLFFDTGTAQTASPAVATLLGWSMELDGASDAEAVRAQVTPDFFSLQTTCPVAETNRCVTRLAEALDQPMTPARHAALAARLVRSARRARADDASRARVLALSAVLGFSGDPFDGFEQPPTQQAIREAKERLSRRGALLMLRGGANGTSEGPPDVDVGPLLAALPPDAPPPSNTPAERPPALQVEGGAGGQLAMAFAFAEAERARAVAEDFSARGLEVNLWRRPQGAVLDVALPFDGTLDSQTTRTARILMHRAQTSRRALRWPASPFDLWLARRAADERDGVRVGMGVICPERAYDTCAQAAESLAETEVAAFEGTQTEGGATGLFADGGWALVRRQPGSIGIAVLWQGGAALDPADQHGRTAVLALALAARCGGTPIVEDHRFGFTREVPAGDIEAVEQTLVCAAEPVGADDWHAAQIRATAFAQGRPEWAWLGSALTPTAPGWAAPFGSLEGIAASARGNWMVRARGRRRASVALVGDIEVAAALEATSFALGLLDGGHNAPGTQTPDRGPRRLVPMAYDGPDHRVVIGWIAPSEAHEATRESAAAFARAASEWLRARGLTVRWRHSGGDGDAHAVIALSLDDAQLENLAQTMNAFREASVALSARPGTRQTAPREVSLRAARSHALATPAPSPATFRALQQSLPTIVVGHPQPADALRRSRR